MKNNNFWGLAVVLAAVSMTTIVSAGDYSPEHMAFMDQLLQQAAAQEAAEQARQAQQPATENPYEGEALQRMLGLLDQVNAQGSSLGIRYGRDAQQGLRRSMEDEECIRLNFDGKENHNFFGVFDGHGGSAAAKYVAEHLVDNVANQLNNNTEETVPSLLENAFAETEQALKVRLIAANKEKCGTCAIVACQLDRDLYVANLGDSRAVLCRNREAVALSDDHKPSRSDERARIEQAGIMIYNSYIITGADSALAVSRAFGDTLPKFMSRNSIIAVPEIRHHKIDNQDEFLILACDGVWDELSNKAVVDFVREQFAQGMDETQAAQALCKRALDAGSRDNVSAIIVRFNQ